MIELWHCPTHGYMQDHDDFEGKAWCPVNTGAEGSCGAALGGPTRFVRKADAPVCQRCNGRGDVYNEHGAPDEPRYLDCPDCEGEGRIYDAAG